MLDTCIKIQLQLVLHNAQSQLANEHYCNQNFLVMKTLKTFVKVKDVPYTDKYQFTYKTVSLVTTYRKYKHIYMH